MVCPYCLEEIKPGAIRCKHCHADLSVLQKPVSASVPTTLESGAIANHLSQLVEKSLVVLDEATARYRMLETVRR